jgi:hypothetical protein
MKRANLFVIPAIVAGCLMSAAAQSKPDFSGRWTTDPDPATTAAPAAPGRAGGAAAGGGQRGRSGDMGSGWGSTITIAQDAAKLTVEYAFFARGDMQPPLKFVYALDGSETKNSVMMGRGIQNQTSRTAWDGTRLVITTTHSFVDPETGTPATVEVKQVLSLESPTSLVVETTRTTAAGAAAKTTKSTYRKL